MSEIGDQIKELKQLLKMQQEIFANQHKQNLEFVKTVSEIVQVADNMRFNAGVKSDDSGK